jgi:hypothetical protein
MPSSRYKSILHVAYQPVAVLLVFITLFGFMCMMNVLTPTWGDDWARTGVHGFLGLVGAAWHEYFGWTGRVAPIFLTTAILPDPGHGMYAFNVVNAAAFCSLILLIFMVANGKIPRTARDAIDILLIFVLVWMLTDSIGETALWKTGAIGYLWAVTAELAILKVFVSISANEDYHCAAWIRRGLPLIALFVGTFLEHLALVSTCALFFLLFDLRRSGKPIPAFAMATAIAHAIGVVVLLLAPGNYIRAEFFQKNPFNEVTPLIFQITLDQIKKGLGPVLLFFLMLCLPNLFKMEEDNQRSKVFFRFFFLLCLSFGCALVLILSPTTPVGRAGFPTEIFFICAIAVLIHNRQKVLLLDIFLSVVAITCAVSAITTSLKDTFEIAQEIKERFNLIERVKATGGTSLTVPQIWNSRTKKYVAESTDKSLFIRDVTSHDTTAWQNKAFERIYGFKSVRSTPSPVLFFNSLPSGLQSKIMNSSDFVPFTNDGYLFFATAKSSCENLMSTDFIFVHLYPSKIKHLPVQRRQFGFENADFGLDASYEAVALDMNGAEAKGICLLYQRLPKYRIDEIVVGRLDANHNKLWQMKLVLKGTAEKSPVESIPVE